MDARLIPINACIGLLSPPGTSWPNPLYSAGYKLVALELPLDTPEGRVVADVVAFDSGTNRFLLVESKSGSNIDSEQSRRYGMANPHQLVRHTDVTVARGDELTADVLYICLSENVDRILTGLNAAACLYPVLAVSDQRVTLYREERSSHLAAILADPVTTPGWPPTAIRVDEHSDMSEFEMIASQALMSEISLGRDSIGVPDLAARAIPHLHIYGQGYRKRLIKKIEKALESCCQASPANFAFRPSTASRDYSIVEVIDSPERADPRGRTQRYQAIERRIRGQPPSEPSSAQQQALFDSIDLGTELEALEASETDDAKGDHVEGGS